MLDTSVYIAGAKDRLPANILKFIESRKVQHCGVAVTELSITAGLLDPRHEGTRSVQSPLRRFLETIDLSNCSTPSPAAWAEAGMLSGILARTQLGLAASKKSLSSDALCCQEGRRRKILLDALLFLTAREVGAILISANVSDMDLLLRFRPDVNVLLYRHVAGR